MGCHVSGMRGQIDALHEHNAAIRRRLDALESWHEGVGKPHLHAADFLRAEHKPGEVVPESEYDARRDPTKPVLRDRNGTELREGDWLVRQVRSNCLQFIGVVGKRPTNGYQGEPGEIAVVYNGVTMYSPPSTVILWRRS